jgi:hypothetical protein
LDDLVTRNSSQDIKVSWTFLGPVTIVKDIAVAGLVDGVDMKELGNKGTLNDFRDVHAFADVEFEQDVVIDSLHVKKNINGQSFQDIFNNILFFVSFVKWSCNFHLLKFLYIYILFYYNSEWKYL